MIDTERMILNDIRKRREKGTVQKPVSMTGFPLLSVRSLNEEENGARNQTIEDWDRAYLLDLVDFLQSLISDLKSEGTAYERGKQDGAREERDRVTNLIRDHESVMRERSITLTGNYLELGRYLIGEINRTRNTVTEN